MRPLHLFFAILTVAIWGLNFVVLKLGMRDIGPLTLCALRFFFAAFPLIFFIKRPNISFKIIVLYGLIMFALQFSLLFMSVNEGMPASLASLLLQTNVFFTMLLATIFLNNKPSFWQVLGAIISFMGIGLIWQNLGGGEITLLSFSLVITAAFFWGIGNLISKQIGQANALSVVTWSSFIACFPVFLIALLIEGTKNVFYSIQHISWPSLASLAYIVLLSTLLSFALWNFLIRKYSIFTIAPFTLLAPIFAMLGSHFFLNEKLQTWKIEAGILIISGLAINLLGNKFFKKKLIISNQTESSVTSEN